MIKQDDLGVFTARRSPPPVMPPPIHDRHPTPTAPRKYRIQQVLGERVTTSATNGGNDAASLASEEPSESSWTRNSVSSEFCDDVYCVTVGRAMRSLGEVFIDPLDTFLGMREFRKIDKFLANLDVDQWGDLRRNFNVDLCAVRVAEALRPMYPPKLRSLAQILTLRLAMWGKVTFQSVVPQTCFSCKKEFSISISDLAIAARRHFHRSLLLLNLPITEDEEGFMSLFRKEVNRQEDEPPGHHIQSLVSWDHQLEKLANMTAYSSGALCLSYSHQRHQHLEEFLNTDAATELPYMLIQHGLLQTFSEEVAFLLCHEHRNAVCYVTAILLSGEDPKCEESMAWCLLATSINDGTDWSFAHFCSALDRTGPFGHDIAFNRLLEVLKRHEAVEKQIWNAFTSTRPLFNLRDKPDDRLHLHLLGEWISCHLKGGNLSEMLSLSPLKAEDVSQFVDKISQTIGLEALIMTAFASFEFPEWIESQIRSARILTFLALLVSMSQRDQAKRIREHLITSYNHELLSWQNGEMRTLTAAQITGYVIFHRIIDLRPELWASQDHAGPKQGLEDAAEAGAQEWQVQNTRAWDDVVSCPEALAHEAETCWLRAEGGEFWVESFTEDPASSGLGADEATIENKSALTGLVSKLRLRWSKA